jgi:hypothetical protein
MGDTYDQESINDSDSSGRDAEEFDGHEEGHARHVYEDDAEDRDEVVRSFGFYMMLTIDLHKPLSFLPHARIGAFRAEHMIC